jgi:3-(3-hydroxy-phenyl)propionate hydroxylase
MDPVIIVGAGPVGQTTALLLARWGVPSIVLDARSSRSGAGSRAICQQRDVLDVWESVGAGRRIADAGVTWTTARTFHRGRELFSTTLAEPGRPAFPPFVNVSQSTTEAILDARIAEEPLIDVRWGHRVVSVTPDAAVTCDDGQIFRGTHVVLCAGGRADALREQLGVALEGRSFDDRFLICDVRADLPGWATERRFHFDPEWNPGRQVLIHPCPDSVFRIDWQVPPDHDLDAEIASGKLDGRIRHVLGEALRTDYELVWSSVYRFQSRVADRMRVGRVLLAGDAAHLLSPFGARGLNSGVADAENAAWKIAYVRNGWAPEELLASYHAERHAAAVENLAVTTATMDFLVPRDDAARRRRQELLAAGDPATIDSGRLSEPFWYNDSPLTTMDPSRPFAGRPPRGQAPPPGPGVIVPDAPVRDTRLRALARDGFLQLTNDGPLLDDLPALEVAEIAHDLGARKGETWLIRPDAHIAATVTDLPTLHEARSTALGIPNAP